MKPDKTNILLHTCCAPCTGYVYELLNASYNVTAYFYNPNISPRAEYDKRLNELKKFSELIDFKLHVGDYDIKRWTSLVKKYRFSGERSERCWLCYRIRLESSFKKAKDLEIGLITTSLSISPHKDPIMINKIGSELAAIYGIEFLEADFKKKDGYKKSVEISKKFGFYRQSYCGCVYSNNSIYRKNGVRAD